MKDNNVFPQRILDLDPEDRFNFFAFSVREGEDTYAHKVFDKLQHTSPSACRLFCDVSFSHGKLLGTLASILERFVSSGYDRCLSKASAKNITTVIPYFGYARADRKAARQLEFLIGRNNTGPNAYSLGDALGLAQQDDDVTGTAKQNVTDDLLNKMMM